MTLTDGSADNVEDSEFSSGMSIRAIPSGELIGNSYRLRHRIGSGGMGDVYVADHCRLGRQFAVKLLRLDGETKTVERFRREAKAIARIESEYVVNVVDCGETSAGIPYMVMDLLRGEDLRALLARASPLPIPRAVNIVCDACEGVAAVHRAGLVHRDLKPGNLFVTRRSTGEDWCKVLDFGVAKMEASSSTAEGALIGTVKYMAPEQLQNGAAAGPAVDIYALGAILYESLSGVPPHSGTSVQELMFKIMNEDPARPDERRREIPGALADAVMRALAKKPEQRFETARAFAAAITPFSLSATPHDMLANVDTLEIEGPSSRRRQRVRNVAALSVGIAASVAVVLSASHEKVSSASATHAQPVATASIATPASTTNEPASISPALASPAASSAPVSVASPSAIKSRVPTTTSARSAFPPSPRFDAENPYAH